MSSPAALAAAEFVVPAGEPPRYTREALARLLHLYQTDKMFAPASRAQLAEIMDALIACGGEP